MMNERIKELAEQAGFYFYDMHDIDGEDCGESIEADSFGAAEKFAEMIIKEYGINISTINLQPDDIILVECANNLKMDQINTIKDIVKQSFPNNDVIILNDGVKLRTAIRADDVSKMSSKEFVKYVRERINNERTN